MVVLKLIVAVVGVFRLVVVFLDIEGYVIENCVEDLAFSLLTEALMSGLLFSDQVSTINRRSFCE